MTHENDVKFTVQHFNEVLWEQSKLYSFMMVGDLTDLGLKWES